MEVFILWIFFSIIAGIIASNKGRSGFGFFLISVLLSPLIGVIAALVAGRNEEVVSEARVSSGAEKKCPFCAELIKSEAIVCRYCGQDLVPVEQDLMDKHNIVFEKGKYVYRGEQYASFQQALNAQKVTQLSK